ncbi:MAG: hypothetical protein ABL896_00085 [Hylemonella sp.]
MKELYYKFYGALERIRSLLIPDSYLELERCDALLCCSDADRTDAYRGLAYSKFIDALAERLKSERVIVQQFTWPYSQISKEKAWGAPKTGNRYFFLHSLLSKIFRLIGRRDYGDARALEFYAKLLALTGARCLIGIGLPQAAIKAAAVAGVKSIELLHGYGYSEVPWGWGLDRTVLPSRVFVFDEVSKDTFGRLGGRGVKVNLIPNYWYERFSSDGGLATSSADWATSYGWIPKSRKVILVSLQWAYDGDHGEYRYFSGLLKNGLFPVELLDVIKRSRESTYWIFRLHPVQLRGIRYRHHRRLLDRLVADNKNCDWIRGSSAPLPSLLRHCHGHITMSSMTAYDAAFMGVRSLLLCPTLRPGGANASMFRDIREMGYAELGACAPCGIGSWVETVQKAPQLKIASSEAEAPLCKLIFE